MPNFSLSFTEKGEYFVVVNVYDGNLLTEVPISWAAYVRNASITQ